MYISTYMTLISLKIPGLNGQKIGFEHEFLTLCRETHLETFADDENDFFRKFSTNMVSFSLLVQPCYF